MHRSGTSAVTRGLECLGAELGDQLLAPSEVENPRGFYEDIPLLEVSEQVLEKLGLRWDSTRLLGDALWRDCDLGALELQATQIIRSRFAGSPLWAFKNPRTARLLPFWQRVFSRVGCDAAYVLAVRNPLSVAHSLQRRNRLDSATSYLLWLLHMTEAINHTRGRPLVCVDYDQLLKDPSHELDRLSTSLSLPMSAPSSSGRKAFVDDFLSSEYRGSKFESEDLELDPELSLLVRRAYTLLHRFARDDDPPSRAQLQRGFSQIGKQLREIAPLLLRLDSFENRLVEERSKAEDWAARSAHFESELTTRSSSLGERDAQLAQAGSEIESLQDILQDERKVFEKNKLDLDSTRVDLASTQADLESTEGERAAIRAGLEVAHGELESVHRDFESSELRVARLKQDRERDARVSAASRASAEKAHAAELSRVKDANLHEKMQREAQLARREEELRSRVSAFELELARLNTVNEEKRVELIEWLHGETSRSVSDLVEACRILRSSTTWKLSAFSQRLVSRLRFRTWSDGSFHLQHLVNELHDQSQRNYVAVEELLSLASDVSLVLRTLLESRIFRFYGRGVALSRTLRFKGQVEGPLDLLRRRSTEVLFFLDELSRSPIESAILPPLVETPVVGRHVDVVIPVHDARQHTLRCIDSVIGTVNQTQTPFEIVVVDDASSDLSLRRSLDQLGEQGVIHLLRNDENLGFTATANRGMALHADRDVVLLNSDTLVHGDWLDRLRRTALSDWNIATVTPFTNNGEICSYPVICASQPMPDLSELGRLDDLAAVANPGLSSSLPTAVGFCTYVRRQVLSEIGDFDEQRFPRGYGEENDFCLRAEAQGYRHLLAADVFVAHQGGASFLDSKEDLVRRGLDQLRQSYPDYENSVHRFIASDPIRILRRRIDVAQLANGGRKSVLMVMHSWGGGTERHVFELSSALEKEGTPVLLLRDEIPGRVTLGRFGHSEVGNLSFDLASDFDEIVEVLRLVPVGHVHIHHLIGFDPAIRDLATAVGVTVDFTVHDYFTLCPRINMVDDRASYCGAPDVGVCNACVKRNGSELGSGIDVEEWRRDSTRLLQSARRVFVPSRDALDRMERHVEGVEWRLRPHPETTSGVLSRRASSRSDEPLRIAVIGAIGFHKGAAVLEECAIDAAKRDLPIEFHVIGYTDRDEGLLSTGKVVIHGQYRDEELQSKLAESRTSLAFLPSVWPETFCYTLSAAFEAGLYPVAFDVGAPSSRIKESGWGEVISIRLSGTEINDHLIELDIPDFVGFPPDREIVADYGDYLSHYYDDLEI
jgi:GT2 family glycosyltransferase/glycosyltransferase involved in cell wall biosynthesis